MASINLQKYVAQHLEDKLQSLEKHLEEGNRL